MCKPVHVEWLQWLPKIWTTWLSSRIMALWPIWQNWPRMCVSIFWLASTVIFHKHSITLNFLLLGWNWYQTTTIHSRGDCKLLCTERQHLCLWSWKRSCSFSILLELTRHCSLQDGSQSSGIIIQTFGQLSYHASKWRREGQSEEIFIHFERETEMKAFGTTIIITLHRFYLDAVITYWISRWRNSRKCRNSLMEYQKSGVLHLKQGFPTFLLHWPHITNMVFTWF